MILFSYRGIDAQGAEVQGTVEATDKDDALKKLKVLQAQGLHNLSIEGAQHNDSSLLQSQSSTTKQEQKPSELPPLWLRIVFLFICLGIFSWAWSSFFPKSPSPSSKSSISSEHTQKANDQRLQQIILDKYGRDGVLKVEVSGPVMDVHVTPEVYRAFLSDRVAGNRIMRGWQSLVAQNDNARGIGAIRLYSDGYKVAEADKDVFSGEVKVRWLDV